MSLKQELEIEDNIFPFKVVVGCPDGVAGYLMAFSNEAMAKEYAGDKFRIMNAETPEEKPG